MTVADVMMEYRQIQAAKYEERNPGKRYKDSDTKTDDKYQEYLESIGYNSTEE